MFLSKVNRIGLNDSDTIVLIVSATGLFTLLTLFIVWYLSMFQKRRQQHTKEMTELQYNYEQTLLRSQLEIQEETLRNISQEIHDNIGQVLSLAKLQLNTFPSLSPEEGVETVAYSKDLVSKAIADLRSLSKSLHPDRVNELGLEENIRHELEMLERTRLYATQFKISGSPYKIPVQTQTILFRIVQEAISNIIKHANASEVEIKMDYEPDQFCLAITDNGIGVHPESVNGPDGGIGIRNMRHRSGIIGARFEILPAPGGGTVIRICVPVKTDS